jgi:hypothetical protein
MANRYASIGSMSEGPKVSFSEFVMSLATTAAVHLGDVADPATGETAVNLLAAGQMIDILAMLQGKTQGNLEADESQVLEALLYELRMRYVEAAGRDKRTIVP